jgi:hypothetical protein
MVEQHPSGLVHPHVCPHGGWADSASAGIGSGSGRVPQPSSAALEDAFECIEFLGESSVRFWPG